MVGGKLSHTGDRCFAYLLLAVTSLSLMMALRPAYADNPRAAPPSTEAPAAPAPAAPASEPAPAVAPAAAAPALPAHGAALQLNAGDTAWMLSSTALVLLMTIPGLALFYGGLVRKKNILATAAQSFAI